MTQITLNVENKAILPHLKKMLNAIDGVTIASAKRKKRIPGTEEAYEEVRAGKIRNYDNVDDLFQVYWNMSYKIDTTHKFEKSLKRCAWA